MLHFLIRFVQLYFRQISFHFRLINCIRGMVEKSAYCPDILVQVAAANAALNAFTKELLANHIKTCVADDIRAGNDEVIDELVTTLQKLMR